MNLREEYKNISDDIFSNYNQTQFRLLVRPKGYLLDDFRDKYIWNLWYGNNNKVKFSVLDIQNIRLISDEDYAEALPKIKWLHSELIQEFEKVAEMEKFKE